ncbi:MAG: dihydroorotate dehydrogenase electron transfer subunit, partial [Candidatus Desulfofervidus sp.]|nr:dihydroorotate dehydrogenase electron transfer subunit [Candidatus Desulfofervidus sp.]
MILETAKIGEQRHFIEEGTEDFYLLTLIAPNIAREAKPGQFVMIKASYTLDPFLRRPFSIFFCEGEKIVLLYKVVGKGTNLMSNWRGGEEVSV